MGCSAEVLVSEACCALLLHAHGQVDEGEDVVLDHDGEAEEDGVQDQDVDTQLQVQPPLVQVNPQDLGTTQETHHEGLCRLTCCPQ